MALSLTCNFPGRMEIFMSLGGENKGRASTNKRLITRADLYLIIIKHKAPFKVIFSHVFHVIGLFPIVQLYFVQSPVDIKPKILVWMVSESPRQPFIRAFAVSYDRYHRFDRMSRNDALTHGFFSSYMQALWRPLRCQYSPCKPGSLRSQGL